MTLALGPIRFGFAIEGKGQTRQLVEQVHGTDIVRIDGPSKKVALTATPVFADGVLTCCVASPIYIFTADCLPLLLFGEAVDSAIAAVHVGWRGAMNGIVSRALNLMGSGWASVHAILGPCLGPCCFEVKSDFVDAFVARRGSIEPFIARRDGRLYFDLPRYVIERELACLPLANIIKNYVRCTYCSSPTLPSFRRTRKTDPLIRAWIELRCFPS